MKAKLFLLISLTFFLFQTNAQQHSEQTLNYIYPKDPLVLKKLSEWQDNKLGLMLTWGTYSQWGIVESWSLCPEDEGWCQRRGPYAANWYEYKKAYENLQTVFNPVKFDPMKWAASAKAAGFKYMLAMAKHHDGFCMFDTKTTDYKITDSKSPFSKDPRSNVTKEILKAFRDDGFMTGVYFSKPDWHAPDYWWSYFPPKDRNPSYDTKKYPERWQKFKDFTFTQMQELLSDYGSVDILWLDGGWVRPYKTIDSSISWQKTIPYDQDIDMPKIAKMGREHQPGLLVVDRTVTGEYENYVTPEQQIPEKHLSYPWESCITMGTSWSYVPNDHYKSPRKLINILCDVVAKGGNLILNIGPNPEGEIDDTAYARLHDMSEWMKVNSEAIFGTRSIAPYREGNLAYTKKANTIYAIYLPGDTETNIPGEIELPSLQPMAKGKVYLLGYTKPLAWKKAGDKVIVILPRNLQKNPPCENAWVLKFAAH